MISAEDFIYFASLCAVTIRVLYLMYAEQRNHDVFTIALRKRNVTPTTQPPVPFDITGLYPFPNSWISALEWALIPAAAICNVSPFELAKRNLIPVLTRLTVTTIAAILLM
ncbi:hypothetical protein [Paenibacillus sp. J45TS6]|uniref:hypothetical protein n=1 Tax=Paenibacillus sp. J45TS6 TaxID=2807196 RepID=UPI001BD0976F|nr:hypothetical protein [Paenibacillus sp. J45TS6]